MQWPVAHLLDSDVVKAGEAGLSTHNEDSSNLWLEMNARILAHSPRIEALSIQSPRHHRPMPYLCCKRHGP